MNHIFQKTVYSSLLIVEEQIRLVRLLPRLLSDDIEIELIRADLASKPQYEALSYEWGPPCDSTSSVFIHGECRLVQENLWWALRYLRLDSQPRILWIDALCINQDDIVERNRQVRQMGRIYEQSSRVIVWMGYLNTIERDQDTSTAVTFLHDISLNYSEYAYRENQPWGSLEKLCYKNYWTRLWIIQEVVLATDILVQCGSYSFEWNILAGILDQLDIFLDHPKFLQEKGLYEVGQMIHKSIPGRLHRQRIARQSEDSKAQSLLNLLWTYKDAACVDPRDKVFGLHSLSEDCCKNALSIDYAKSTFEIGGMLLEHHFSHHMGASELLPFPACQRLHDLLQAKISFVISSRSLRPIDYHYGSAEDKLVELAGTVVGNISWLSPFFDSLPPDDVLITSESKKAAAYQKMMGDIPQIRMIMSSLNYPLEFWRQLPPRIPPPLYKDATHAGLTFSLQNLDSFATGALRAQPPPLQYSRSIRKVSDSLKASLKNRASIVSDKWVEKDSDSIFRWWKWLVSPCPKDERPRTRILFSGNGLIGFAPGTADVGDVVCQIDNSDTFVVLRPGVVRPSGLRHEIIGRSSIIQLGTPTSPGVEPAKARLQVDIPTLQLLSWVKES